MPRAKRSEVHAYNFIQAELVSKKGWKAYQVYTQQECQKINAVKKHILNKRPENVVEINKTNLYVIEAKNDRNKLVYAVKEAQEDYADKINNDKRVKANFCSGVAGNDKEGFIVQSKFFNGEEWEIITENDYEVTGLLSKSQVERILENQSAKLSDVEIDEKEFLKSAENINEILHNGAINKDYRARVISALLLALAERPNIGLDENPSVLISNINSIVDVVLRRHNKQEFSRFIKLDLPSSEDNHIKFKDALIKTIQELLELNIRSAMKSGKDVLGKFYEVFLKYGNGAKEIGIVLTPRNITRFAAEILNINVNDFVYDPTCGTGGFLVAALDEVKKKENSSAQFEEFKKYGIYGIEQQDPVVALALVNMIFRGDGKNNIIEGNCFNKYLNAKTIDNKVIVEYLEEENENRIQPITKVLMNPPFSLKGENEREYDYIEHALNQMANEGLLFAIIPMSVFLKGGSELNWRKNYLLKNHTLLSVITFPEDIFYPIGVRTVGIIIKKGIPHNETSKVFWAKITKDGYVKSKGKRLQSNKVIDELQVIKDDLIKHINGDELAINKPKFIVTKPIDFEDKQLELVSEAYLDEGINSVKNLIDEIDNFIRELISFLITSNQVNNYFIKFVKNQKTKKFNKNRIRYKIFKMDEIFGYINTGDFHVSSDLDKGKIPLISCKTIENGTEGYFGIDSNIFSDCITIASDGSWPITSFFHPYKFAAKDNVIVCKPKKDFKELHTVLFITAQLNSQIWRFSYGRKCYLNKTDKIQIPLPIDNDYNVDFDVIKQIVNACEIWNDIKTF